MKEILRNIICQDEDDIQLILKRNNSYFINYEIHPGIHTIKDISEAVYPKSDRHGTVQIEYYDITMKRELILTPFELTFGVLRFDEKFFFNTLSGFTPYWDYKPTNAIHADNPGVYTSGKFCIYVQKMKFIQTVMVLKVV